MKKSRPYPPSGRPSKPRATYAVLPLGSAIAGSLPPIPSFAAEIRTISDAHVGRPSSFSSSHVIDLTLDDEEDEPIGSQGAPQSVVATESVSSTAADALGMSIMDEAANEVAAVAPSLERAEVTSQRMMPLVEDIESDVDEEWPHVPAKAALSVSPLVANHVFYSQTRKEVGATLGAICKTMPLSLDRKRENGLKQNDQVKVTGQVTCTPSLYDDDGMEADVDEELPSQAPKLDAHSPTTADRIVEIDNLEDGEIFEEGVVPKPVMQGNMLPHQSESAGMRLVDIPETRPHLRSKKQKKRGKKKTKRKLDVMQMIHAPPGQMYPDYERTIRQRPFTKAPSPGHYTLAKMTNGPRGEAMNVRPVFQNASPALFRAGGLHAGVPHPSIRFPPQQQRPPRPLPPPYEDSQILRVNRQGSMEMVDSEAKLSLGTTISEPPIYGEFKYRSVSVFPPPTVPHGPGLPLQRPIFDASRLPLMSSSGGCNTSNSVATRGRDESMGVVDLDSLRAAALRTKTKRSLKKINQVTETASAVQSSSSVAHSEEKEVKRTSPEIDMLRFDILRSMTKNRNRTANSKIESVLLPMPEGIKLNAIEQADESGMNKGTTSNSAAVRREPSVLKDPLKITLTNMSAGAIGNESDGPSSESNEPTIASEQNQVVSKTESQLATSSEKAMPLARLAVSTPEFRPLTACSQSLVIQLGPEDYLPRKHVDDARNKATPSSSLQDAIKEMRRKIAEREKEQINRSLASAGTRPGSKQFTGVLPSSALSTPSSESKVSSVVTQLLSATAASPGVSSPSTETMKESSAGTNVDSLRSAQTEANQEKKVTKDILPSPSGTFLSVETAKLAAGRDSPLKPATDPHVRNNSSGVSTIVDMHVLLPILQHHLQASSDGRNGDSAREFCVKNSVEPVSTDISRLKITDNAVAEKPCDGTIAEKPISSDEPVFDIDHDFDAIRAEYQECVAACEEAEVHIARLSKEMAQLKEQLAPVEGTV